MKDKKPLISVIVPVYNAEKYINNCIESVLSQTYNNIEILIIDDGSNDKTFQICKMLEQKDYRITLYQTDNQGAANARNIGIKNATGEFVLFVDADDAIEPQYVEILLNSIKENNCDIICSGFKEDDGKNTIEKVNDEIELCGLVEYFSYYCELKNKNGNSFNMCTVWGKLFKTEVVKTIEFENYKYSEDKLFIMEVMKNMPRAKFINYSGYNYLRREDSLTMKSKYCSKDYIRDILAVEQLILSLIKNYDHKLFIIEKNIYENEIVNTIFSIKNYGGTYKQFKDCKKDIITHIKNIKKIGIEHTKSKMVFMLYRYFTFVLWERI